MKYFIGAPIYYIVENGYKGNPFFDYTDPATQRSFCQNNVSSCNANSIPNFLTALQAYPNITSTAPAQVSSTFLNLLYEFFKYILI